MTVVIMVVVVFLSENVVCGQEKQQGQNTVNFDTIWVTRQCEKAKQEILKDILPLSETEVSYKLIAETNVFRGRNKMLLSQQECEKWNERLKIADLDQKLRFEGVTIDYVDELLSTLRGNDPKLSQAHFVRFRNALENKRDWLVQREQSSSTDEVETFFDSLPDLIGAFLESPDADGAIAISRAIISMTEAGCGKELIAFLREQSNRPNVKLQVRSELMKLLFEREIDEPVAVNENILGTLVRGSGQLDGKLNAEFVPSDDTAIIRVTLAGKLNTSTVVASGPVRVHSNNRTEVTTVKDIVIGKKSITTTPARTGANQHSQIGKVVYTRPGPLVQMLAPSQIRNRKPANDAESERLTKRRFNTQVDDAVGKYATRFNEVLDELIAGRGNENDLRLRFDRLSTMENMLFVDAVAVGETHLAAWKESPAVDANADLFFQVHESVPYNAGDCELSGKTLVEEQIVAKLKEQFPKLIDNLKLSGNGEEQSLTVEFGDSPVRVTFAENNIKATIETTSIEREGNRYPGMTLEFQFRIENMNDGFQLVAEGPPDVLPVGFDKENDLLSVRETTIRAIIMKKLVKAFEKPIEWTESAIEGENGTLTFKPTHLSTADGWLSIGLDVVDWKPKQTQTILTVAK